MRASSLAAAYLLAASAAVAAKPIGPAAPLPDVDEVYPAPVIWEGARVLHIGDSHVSRGLTGRLRIHLARAGARYRTEMWVGSRSKSWVASGRLAGLLSEHHPNVVLVTLGTNAMRSAHPEKYCQWIRSLSHRVGPRRCFWIGPPPLVEGKEDSELLDLLPEHSRPCRYFDTRQLGFSPRKDGKFHLTRRQGERWADAIWLWMNGGIDPNAGEDAL